MPHSSGAPKGWPSNAVYLTKLQYAKSANPDQISATYNFEAVLSKASVGPSPLVKITTIIDATHPAHGECGLFATRTLPPDSFILFYLGFVHGPEDADESSNYDLSLDRDLGIGIDATKMGSEARFINDYRGIRPIGPNAEFRDCWVDIGGGKKEKRIGVYVLSAGKSGKRSQGIGKGEEILVSYGKGFWAARG